MTDASWTRSFSAASQVYGGWWSPDLSWAITMSRHLGTWKVPGSSNTPTLSHKKHFEFSSPDPPNVPLGFLHVLPAGAWCCVSPSALYTHDSQKLGIAELTDSSFGQPVNICSPDKMPGLQTQLRGGLGLIDSYSFACCLFFKIKFIFQIFIYVYGPVSLCACQRRPKTESVA